MQQNYRSFPVIVVLVAMALVLAMGSAAWAKPNTLVRDEIPAKYKWNLSDIYPDWATWEAGLAELETIMDRYAGLQGTLVQGADKLLYAFELSDSLGMLAYKVYRYPALSSVTDTRNNEISAKLQQVQILFGKFGVATAWFNPELLSIPWETTEQWLSETPALAPYRYSIEDLYRQQEHVLDEEKEQLLSYFSQFRGTPGSIYRELSTSDITFPDAELSSGD
ncbi:MAG: oligoendopeptidase F family protein, partial [Planctomycetes bacterium]|nr:oligoendopeptidase F family protein [Planctomycetota bacterium]